MKHKSLPLQIRWLIAFSLILPLLVSRQALTVLARPAVQGINEPDAKQIELVGQIGGQSQAIYITSNLAYAVIGPQLFLLDIATEPGKVSRVVGSLALPQMVDVHAVYAVDGYAYLTSGVNGLLVIDVRNPAQPALVGQLALPGQANDVVVQGSYAYVADGTSGVHAIDVSQKNQPVLVDTVSYDSATVHSAFALVAVGNYLYVADYDRLLTVDKSNPAQLSETNSQPQLGAVDIAYVANATAPALYLLHSYTTSNRVQEYLIDTPSEPTPKRSKDINGSKLAANNNYIYLLEPDQDGHSVYVFDRNTFGVANSHSYGGSALDLVTKDDTYVYKLDRNAGLEIYIMNGSILSSTNGGWYSDFGSALGMDLYENNLHVAAGARGLISLDITNPNIPQPVRKVNIIPNVIQPASTAAYSYLAGGVDGLTVIPAFGAGYELGSYTESGMEVNDLTVRLDGAKTNVYLATNNGLVVVDGTTPATMTPLGSFTTPNVNEIQTSPDQAGATMVYAYLATTEGFRILNVTNPGSIQPVGSYTAQPVVGMDVYTSLKTYAYLCHQGGLDILDISQPANIQKIGNDPGACIDVDVLSNRAYVLTSDRILVFDISNPSNPEQIGYHSINGAPGELLAVQRSGSPYIYLYVADTLNGLWIFRYTQRIFLPITVR